MKIKIQSRLLANIFTVFSFDMLAKCIVAVTTVLLIRILNTNDYAAFTLFNSISSFISGVIATGICISYVRFESENSSRLLPKNDNLFKFNFLLITSIHLLLMLFLLAVYVFYENEKLFYDVGMFFWGIFYAYTLALQRLNESYYQAREKFQKAGLILNIKNFVLLLLIGTLMMLRKFSLIYIVVSITSISFLVSLYITTIIFRNISINKINSCLIIEYLSASGWLILYYLLLSLFNQMDVFMISHFLGKLALSNYGVANKYYNLLLSLLPSIFAVLRVRTAKADMVDDLNKQREFAYKWIKTVVPYVVVLVVGAIIVSRFIFPILNGDKYNDAIVTFHIFCLGAGCSYIFAPNVSVLMSMKRNKTLCFLGFIACIFNYIGNYILIPIYGINAAAATTILAHMIINIFSTLILFNIKRFRSI
jgi:O-antigen/teichoic acid export membrane protein